MAAHGKGTCSASACSITSLTASPHAGAQELQQQLTSVQAELAALSQGGEDVTMVEGEGNAGTAAALAAAAPAASEVGDCSCQANVLLNIQHAALCLRLLHARGAVSHQQDDPKTVPLSGYD